jgi:uncharacterized membrane protein YphA (DoxX/SURF4 family)
VQRLFPSFPSGWPGAGLLLLRTAVGAAVAVHGAASLAAGHGWRWMAGAVALAAGALLLVGLATPLASTLAAAIAAIGALAPFGTLRDPLGGADCGLWVAITALALVPLGPGAFSLDARWFGRRELTIPRRPPPPASAAPGI